MWLRHHLPVWVDTVSSYYLLALCEPVLAYVPGTGIEVSKRHTSEAAGWVRLFLVAPGLQRKQRERASQKARGENRCKIPEKYTGMLNGEEGVIPKESVRRRSLCAVSRGKKSDYCAKMQWRETL